MAKGGPRPKTRPDDRRGGARPGSGPAVQRIHLDRDTAAALRVLTLARRGVTGNAAISPVDVVRGLILAAYAEYEAGITDDAA